MLRRSTISGSKEWNNVIRGFDYARRKKREIHVNSNYINLIKTENINVGIEDVNTSCKISKQIAWIFGIKDPRLIKISASRDFISFLNTLIPQTEMLELQHNNFYRDYCISPSSEGNYFVKLWCGFSFVNISYMTDSQWVAQYLVHEGDFTQLKLDKFLEELYNRMKNFNVEKKFNEKAFENLFLPNELLTDIKEDLTSFIKNKEMYKRMKLTWKRGYMLIGPPGNGKTMLMRSLCHYFNLEPEDVKDAISRDGSLDFSSVREFTLDGLVYESERPRVFIMEDIDKFVTFQSGDDEHRDVGKVSLHDVLKAMDGIDQHEGYIVFATTNFANLLSDAINRPGRFDRIYNIELPKQEQISDLIKFYDLKITDCATEEFVKHFDKFSMAFIVEFIKTAKIAHGNEISSEEALKIIKRIKDHNKMVKDKFGKDLGRMGL